MITWGISMAWHSLPYRALFPEKAALGDKGLCTDCGKPLGKFRDELSKIESKISGFCQACQDEVWTSQVDEEF